MKLEQLRERFARAPIRRFRLSVAGDLPPSKCQHCGATTGVQWEPSRTMYPETEKDPEPNAPLALCRDCAREHHEYWDEQWNEYNRGRL